MKNLFYIVLAVMFVSVTAFAAVSSFPYSYGWTGASSVTGDGNWANNNLLGGGAAAWTYSATGGNTAPECVTISALGNKNRARALDLAVSITQTTTGAETFSFAIKHNGGANNNSDVTVRFVQGATNTVLATYNFTSDITTTYQVKSVSLPNGVTGSFILRIQVTTANVNGADSPALFVDDAVIPADGALPIQLSSFTGVALENTVQLDWATESETNNYGFYVERMNENEATYTELSFVAGAGTTLEPQVYTYIDENVASGKYYYRLRQVDLNGDFTYSQPIQVVVNGVLAVGDNVGPVVFKLNQNYPNPFNPSTEIKYSVATAGLVTLKVYNLIGQEVASLVNQEQPAGFHTVTFDASNLSSGIYVYRLSSGAETAIKSMMLVK